MSRFNRIFDSISTLIFIPKIEAIYSIARIMKSDCNLIARKRLVSTKILDPRTFRSRTEQIYSSNALKVCSVNISVMA